MEKHTIVDLMSASLQKIREMVDVDTVVGKAISTPDGTTIIPVSRVSFGFGAAGSDLPYEAKGSPAGNFGGGSGAGIKIVPVAFLIVNGDNVNMIPVAADQSSQISRVVDALPGAIDKLLAVLRKNKKPDDDFEISSKDIVM